MTPALEPHMTTTPQGHFASLHRSLDPAPAAWLDELRTGGIRRFEQTGFPTQKTEAWRWTNVQPIARTHFDPAPEAPLDDSTALAGQYSFASQAIAEIVFVNGHFSAPLSRLSRLPRGARVVPLSQALRSDGERVRQSLGRLARVEGNPFVALNTGFIREGAFIHLEAGTTIAQPIHILLISTGGRTPTVSHPRVLVVADDGVKATVVESYVGAEKVYFTNAVTEIFTGENCLIDHCRLQQESLNAYHVSTMQVELGRSTTFVSHAATMGARLSRNDLNCVMNGEYAYATLNGLVLIDGEQHCDNHTLLHHEKPNCPSHELYKHVLGGRSTGVFKGQIFVQKDAQKTDSKQNSKSLLLSDDAYMNSQPALEIYADDVKCTHGSTTGPVDEDMVFYLRTRGIPLEAARHLLTYAFAADITRRIKVEAVRTRIEDFMAARHGLPQDIRINDLGAHDDEVVR